jgi:tetratricopeptide (TPR) repeat protein
MLTCGACLGAAADHEVLGDRAYASRRFSDALAEYRLALVQRAPDPNLRAKAGAAALRASDLSAAVVEYVALADEGGAERVAEAGTGLEHVATIAIRDGDRAALSAALAAMQRVAPGRGVGPFAGELARSLGAVPGSPEVLAVLTLAAAGATDARTQDSLIFEYAVVLRRLGRCEQAVSILESVVRRERVPAVIADARRELARCALALGARALDQGRPQAAEQWFQRAALGAGSGPSERAAYVGLGDVRLAQGDFGGAAEAYQRALEGALPSDSIARIAAERLNMIGRAPGTDRQ